MKWVKTLLWMAIFFFAILFSWQNREEVVLRFGLDTFQNFGLGTFQNYQWEVSKVPLFLVILCSVFLGILIGGTSGLLRRFQLAKVLRQNQKKIDLLEREVQSLRNTSLDQPSFLKKEV